MKKTWIVAPVVALLGTALPAMAENAASTTIPTSCVAAKGKIVTLEVKSAPLGTLLSMLAKKGAFSYVLDQGVNPDWKVTTRLNSVSISDAWDAILASQGLTCSKRGNVILVSRIPKP